MKTGWNNGGSILVRVGPHHFAFLRGYFEGLALATLSRRYLETAVSPDPDLRIAKSTLKWIREQLMVAARRRGLFAEARLILLDPEKLRGSDKRPIPTLEEFREIRDPHELFSEAELLELFHEEYGNNAHSDRRTTRNERLRRKQINALLSLEKLLGSPPSPSDDVTGWLHPVLAKRLKNAGLDTLMQLIEAINVRGYRWWTGVPRFGEKAAAQVVAWLSTESTTRGLGVKLGIQATTPARSIPIDALAAARPKQFGIVPIEFLSLPPHLDGSDKSLHLQKYSGLPPNDLEAIRRWLGTKEEGSHTWRSYRKEAERFLLWATLERGKSLSSLSRDDCHEYLEFLKHLDSADSTPWRFRLPRIDWISPRGTKRWSPLWRPFEGGLSLESRKLAKTILSVMGRSFVECGYWATNPWEDVSEEAPAPQKTSDIDRFSAAEWLVLSRHLDRLKDPLKAQRLRFMLVLFRETGIRVAELVHSRRGDVHFDACNPEGYGFIKIRIGSRKTKEFRLNKDVMIELDSYLKLRGCGGMDSCPPSAPLIARLPNESQRSEGECGISANGLYFIFKEFFTEIAKYVGATSSPGDSESNAYDGIAFQNINGRWLRLLPAPLHSSLDG